MNADLKKGLKVKNEMRQCSLVSLKSRHLLLALEFSKETSQVNGIPKVLVDENGSCHHDRDHLHLTLTFAPSVYSFHGFSS